MSKLASDVEKENGAFNIPECEIGMKDELNKDFENVPLSYESRGFHGGILWAFGKSNRTLRYYDSGLG